MLQATRAALAAEEPRVDRLQAQLKELIVSPQDPQPLSDSVVAAVHAGWPGAGALHQAGCVQSLGASACRPLGSPCTPPGSRWPAVCVRPSPLTRSLPEQPPFLPGIRVEQNRGWAPGRPQPGSSHVSDTPAACSFPGENARSWEALGDLKVSSLQFSHSVVSDSVRPQRRSPPGSPVPGILHPVPGILQARTPEWVAISFSRGSF